MKDFKDYKQMENAGWENMHSLLDQHMPHKKKRFALLYFTGFMFGVFLLISFLSWLNYKSFPKQTNEPKESTLAIENHKENLESHDILVNNNSVNSPEKINDLKGNHKPQSDNSFLYSTNPNSNHSNFNRNQQANTNPDIVSSSLILDKNEKTTKNEIDQFESETVINEPLKREMLDILSLPGLMLTSIQSNEENHNSYHLQFPEIIKPLQSKSSGKFQFGIQTGIQYFTSNKTISYLAGGQLEYKLADKWSLSFSLNLEMKKGNFLILNDEERAQIVNNLDSFHLYTDLFLDSDKEVVTSGPAAGLNSVAIERYSHLFNLQLPLTLNYKVNKHWQTSLSMKFLIPLQKDLITSNKSNIIQWNTEQTSSWKINPINYFAQAGIKYFPWPSIGISLDYSMALSSLKATQGASKTSSIQNSYPITENTLNHISTSLRYMF